MRIELEKKKSALLVHCEEGESRVAILCMEQQKTMR